MLNYTALEKLEKQANQGADKTVLNPEFKNWSTKQKWAYLKELNTKPKNENVDTNVDKSNVYHPKTSNQESFFITVNDTSLKNNVFDKTSITSSIPSRSTNNNIAVPTPTYTPTSVPMHKMPTPTTPSPSISSINPVSNSTSISLKPVPYRLLVM